MLEYLTHVGNEFGPFLNGPFTLDYESFFSLFYFLLKLLVGQIVVLFSDLTCVGVFGYDSSHLFLMIDLF